jgi:DNA-directed RNA polymerase specialized sigma subunit
MTAKEFLQRGIRLDKRVKTCFEQIQYLRVLQTSAGTVVSHINSRKSGKKDRLGDITAQVLDLIEEYQKDIDELLRIKAEIKQAIKRVEREDYRFLLRLRYECFLKWEQIAVEMECSWQHVHRLHQKALKKIKEVIECDPLDMI